ncbi:hypothetical protein M5K25_016355 [Dendrobium thyrsiflorum]|uniref:Reverse transcriptase zinc-binding domain-containing protein n=1 Tax=Dendrobium thyrsiflorum TaxID=117978 RepID=A0ABD0UJK2_DENTH
MAAAFWNCRGARESKASLYLKEFVKEFEVIFVGLLETKLTSIDRNGVNVLIGSDWDFCYFSSDGLSGGILALWKTNLVSFSVLKTASQCIIGDLNIQDKGVCRISTVYGSKDVGIRRELWGDIEFYSSKQIPAVVGAKLKDLNLMKASLKRDILDLQLEEANGGGLSAEKLVLLRSKDGNGRVVEEQKQIEEIFFNFFGHKWRQRECRLEGWPSPLSVLDDEDRKVLEEELSLEEVMGVVRNLRDINPQVMMYKDGVGGLEDVTPAQEGPTGPIQPGPDIDEVELIHQCLGSTISALAFEASAGYSSGKLYWGWIKKLKLNPRVENFWWRLFHNAIPKFQFLMHRKLRYNNSCPRVCMEIEDFEHVVVGCSKLTQVIQTLNLWGFDIPVFQSFNECIVWLEWNASKHSFLGKIYYTVVFMTWKSRSKGVHGGNEDTTLFIASKTVSVASITSSISCGNLNSGLWGVNPPLTLVKNSWHPPPPEWIKVNVDVCLLPTYKASIGGVCRDLKGRFLLAFGFSALHWDIFQLELLGVQSLSWFLKSLDSIPPFFLLLKEECDAIGRTNTLAICIKSLYDIYVGYTIWRIQYKILEYQSIQIPLGQHDIIILCTEDMLNQSIWDAVHSEQPNLKDVEELSKRNDTLRLYAGIRPAVFAALVPNSANKLLKDVAEEIMGDHEMLSAKQTS